MGIFQLAMLVYSRVTPTTTLFLLPKAVVKTPPDRRLRTSVVVLRPLRKWWGLAFGTWQRSTLGWKLHKYTLWGGELCVWLYNALIPGYPRSLVVTNNLWVSQITIQTRSPAELPGIYTCWWFMWFFCFPWILGCESRWITRFCKWLWKYFRMIYKIRFTRWAPTSHKVITPISRVISHNPSYTFIFGYF